MSKYTDMIGVPVAIKTYHPKKKVGFMKYESAYTKEYFGYIHYDRLSDLCITIKDRGCLIHIKVCDIIEIRKATQVEELLM